jgi:O-methyltransferase involved in polyketide biosynthesis
MKQPAAALPAALASVGLDAAAPTLTIWEGVTMYLDAATVDATTRAVAAWSAPGSSFTFTYFDAARIARPGPLSWLVLRALRGAGEPITFGFEPGSVGGFLAARGFAVRGDVPVAEAAPLLLPPSAAALVADRTQRVVFSLRSQADT